MAIVKRKLKSGGLCYKVFVRDPDGRWYQAKQFERKIDAQQYEAELIQRKSKGERTKKREFREITLSEYYHETWKIEARTKVSLGWRSSENQMFRDHVEPYIGEFKLIEIQKKDIAKLLAELSEKKKLGPQTIKHVHKLLSSIFKYSIEISEIRESNPVLSKFAPKVPKHVPRYLDPNSARDFLEAVSDHWLGPAIWIMMGAGLRVGEVVALQYGDIDLLSLKISLRRQWRRKEKRIAEVKNKEAEKAIPIAVELAEYLREKLSPFTKPSDWVVQSRNKPGQMISYYTIYGTLKKLCIKHNFPLLSPHGLRHTTSGLWNEIGAERGDLRDLYNHKDDSTTERYDHRVPERLNQLGRQVRLKKGKTPHVTEEVNIH
jgi:integrase